MAYNIPLAASEISDTIVSCREVINGRRQLPVSSIPAAVHDVAEYTGDIGGGNVTVDNATATAPFNVYWVAESQGKGRFAARGEISYVGEPYHADWPGRERWCDTAGLPLSGKLYRRLNDNALLARDAEGNALTPVTAGTDIDDVDTALLAREWLAYVEWENPANMTFDPDGHPDASFGIYDLWLTTAEAHAVLREGMERGSGITGYHFSSAAPTALTPKRTSGNETYYLMQSAATLPGGRAGELCYAYCWSLRTIWGEVTRVDGTSQFTECYALENVTFMLDSWCEDFSLVDSPALSYDTMKSLAVNTPRQSGDRTLVITVHADVYAKLTGDMSNFACASLSLKMRDLWAELLDEAASKNIIFAT